MVGTSYLLEQKQLQMKEDTLSMHAGTWLWRRDEEQKTERYLERWKMARQTKGKRKSKSLTIKPTPSHGHGSSTVAPFRPSTLRQAITRTANVDRRPHAALWISIHGPRGHRRRPPSSLGISIHRTRTHHCPSLALGISIRRSTRIHHQRWWPPITLGWPIHRARVGGAVPGRRLRFGLGWGRRLFPDGELVLRGVAQIGGLDRLPLSQLAARDDLRVGGGDGYGDFEC